MAAMTKLPADITNDEESDVEVPPYWPVVVPPGATPVVFETGIVELSPVPVTPVPDTGQGGVGVGVGVAHGVASTGATDDETAAGLAVTDPYDPVGAVGTSETAAGATDP